MTSLSLIGVGRIGGEVAFLASFLGIVDELNMNDVNTTLLHAQISDLKHAMPGLEITTGLEAAMRSEICIFTAGIPRNPLVPSRADLLKDNLPVAVRYSERLRGYRGILITVTNPSDILNYQLSTRAEINPSRCIGFGGQLDSARFAGELISRGIKGEAWVLGEHGEHQVPIFSILGSEVGLEEREEIRKTLRSASMGVIAGKGGTIYGPAAHITELISAIVDDTQGTYACSCILDGEYGISGCSIGVPAVIGEGGILEIEEWSLDEWERKHLEEGAQFLKDSIKSTG
ncbi:MAG: lactate dehydrogenase [Methanomicrobiales archaeon]|nr:lactate dehydrogenase [Methanomicrobiales archaeon]